MLLYFIYIKTMLMMSSVHMHIYVIHQIITLIILMTVTS